ncbi:hypothetical protein CF15_01010 [Pyrodictium occultum]|uniref:UspA domain-containing protein n=1 Tax=Pyrodictium occultum TaxID=2309 RepID=A0A0V8RU03_PYROC|nr:hypothetical protein CF15_01010 [Pyrodictium occultum]
MEPSGCSYRHALVGLDLSRVSDLLVSWLPSLQRVGTRVLTLVHAIPLEEVEHVAAGYPVDRLEEELRQEALERLKAYAAELRSRGFEVEILRPVAGVPAVVLAEEAARLGADYIVVAERGQGWLRRILLGSTSEEVAQIADRSVLVSKPYVRAEGERSLQAPGDPWGGPLLAALALDEGDEPVLCRAVEAASRTGARLVLLHVLEEGEDEEEARRRLEELAERARSRGAGEVEAMVAKGKPSRAILGEAARLDANIIFIGAGGERGRELGTTAEAVLRRAKVHVLVCK